MEKANNVENEFTKSDTDNVEIYVRDTHVCDVPRSQWDQSKPIACKMKPVKNADNFTPLKDSENKPKSLHKSGVYTKHNRLYSSYYL